MRFTVALTAALLFSLPVAAQNCAPPSAAHRALSRLRHAIVPRVGTHKAKQPASSKVSSVTPAPTTAAFTEFEQNPINQLRGNGRVLLVFAPDSTTPALRQQMLFLDRHELDLTSRNTVLVSIVLQRHNDADPVYAGENLPAGTTDEQLIARRKFGVQHNDFALVLLDSNGNELFRSASPIPAADLARRLDANPEPIGTFQQAALVSTLH